MNVRIVAFLVLCALIFLSETSCGGGGGGSGNNVVVPQIGSIDGYVMAPVGSELAGREASTLPALQPLGGAKISAACGGQEKSSLTDGKGYFYISGLPAVTCEIEQSKEGYETFRFKLAVEAGTTTTINEGSFLTLLADTVGAIHVTANVSGASVFLDNLDTGIDTDESNEAHVEWLAVGEHSMSLAKSGLDAVEPQMVTVLESQVVNVSFSLNPTGNQRPIAYSGGDYKGFAGLETQLDGTGSSDPDGESLTYLWEQTGGVPGELLNSTTPTPSFIPGGEGDALLRLTVNDGYVNSQADDFTLSATRLSGRIAFTSSINAQSWEIFSAKADGSDPFQLTENSQSDSQPFWSPNELKIIYSCIKDDGSGGLIENICLLEGEGLISSGKSINQSVVNGIEGFGAKFNPVDASEILYVDTSNSSYWWLRTRDLESGAHSSILSGSSSSNQPFISDVVWRNDGKAIVYGSTTGNDNYEIFSVGVNGGKDSGRFTEDPYVHLFLDHHPIESKIIYTSSTSFSSRRNLWIMNSDGSDQQLLAEGNFTSPIYAMDGEVIYYFEGYDIWVMHGDGAGRSKLNLTGIDIAWTPYE